jgi:hypothetical protein
VSEPWVKDPPSLALPFGLGLLDRIAMGWLDGLNWTDEKISGSNSLYCTLMRAEEGML